MKLLKLGCDLTIVTARTCHLTPMGRANIDNLARYARTIEVVPNMTVRAKLNRLALEMVGDISWPEHVSIFTAPFKVAVDLGIPLLFYGECPQEAYGGPLGSDEARVMTRRWVSEFGGFLGLRPTDFIGIEGITERDMADYMPPDADAMLYPYGKELEAHFLGQYYEWDSRRNAAVAVRAGMQFAKPHVGNWWVHENLDNAQTGLHDYFMWLKYGFSRGCQQLSVDIRAGAVKREDALPGWLPQNEHLFPEIYAGVPVREVLDRIGMTREQLQACIKRFANPEVVDV